ncbi:hypothetical protein THTE_2042 [Thermogutta terrifontis]|uniref:Uncharacterized protein n=1 Tax=Thermogutta terrifontis TaxID=1331910 RepID=A0A286RFA4_9BACT|nr:hypothetical protein THTE_2042 [Thermogutta terrifontis]
MAPSLSYRDCQKQRWKAFRRDKRTTTPQKERQFPGLPPVGNGLAVSGPWKA